MTEDDVRGLLRELRDEPVPADSLARVRLAVAERSRAGTWTQWLGARWKMVSVLAAAVMIMVIALRVHHSNAPLVAIQSDAAVDRVPSPPVSSQQRMEVRKSVAAKPKYKNRHKTAPAGEDVLVRIETADPDVVILLVGD